MSDYESSDSSYLSSSDSSYLSSSEDSSSSSSDNDCESTKDERLLQNKWIKEQDDIRQKKETMVKEKASLQQQEALASHKKLMWIKRMQDARRIRDSEEKQIRTRAIIEGQYNYNHQQQIFEKMTDAQQSLEHHFRSQKANAESLEEKNAALEQNKKELRKQITIGEEQYNAHVEALKAKLLDDINIEHEKLKNAIEAARDDATQQADEFRATYERNIQVDTAANADANDMLEERAHSTVAQARTDIYTREYLTNARRLAENMKKGDFSGRFLRGSAPVEELFQAFKTEMKLAWDKHQDSLRKSKQQLDDNVGAQNGLFENIQVELNNVIQRLNNQIIGAREKKTSLEREQKALSGERASLQDENAVAVSQRSQLKQMIDSEKAKLEDLQPYMDSLLRLEEERKEIIEKYQQLHETEKEAHNNKRNEIKEEYEADMKLASKLLRKEVHISHNLEADLKKVIDKLEKLRKKLISLKSQLKIKLQEREDIFNELDEHEKERPETRDLITVPKVFHSCVEDGLTHHTWEANFFLWKESLGNIAIKAAVSLIVPGCQVSAMTEGVKNRLPYKLLTDDVAGNVDAFYQIPQYIVDPQIRKEFLAKILEIVGGEKVKKGMAQGAGNLAGAAAGWMAGSASSGGTRVFNTFLASTLASNIAEKGASVALHGLGSALSGHCYIIQQILIALMSKEECSIENHQAYFYNRDATTKERRIMPGWTSGELGEQISHDGISIDQQTFKDDMRSIFGTGSTKSKANRTKVDAWLNNRRRLRYIRDKDRSVYDYLFSESIGFWVSSGFKDCNKSEGAWETGECYANNLLNLGTAGAEATRNLGYWVKGNASEVLSTGGAVMDGFLKLLHVDTNVQGFFENSAPLCPDGCISGKSSIDQSSGDEGGKKTNKGIDYGLWLRDLNVLFFFWREENEQYDGAGAVLYIDIEPPGETYWPFYISDELDEDTPGQMKTLLPQPETRNERLIFDEMLNKGKVDINMSDVKTLHHDGKTEEARKNAKVAYTNMLVRLDKRQYVDPDRWPGLPNYMQRMYRKMRDAGFQKKYDQGPLYEQDIMLQQLAGFLEEWRKDEKDKIDQLNAVEDKIGSIKNDIVETEREIKNAEKDEREKNKEIKQHNDTVKARIASDEAVARKDAIKKRRAESTRYSNVLEKLDNNEEGELRGNAEDTDADEIALSDAEDRNRRIEAFVKEKNAEIASINAEITKRKEIISVIDTRLAELKHQIADIDAEISTKNAENLALNAQIEATRKETDLTIKQLHSDFDARQLEEKVKYETIAETEWENYNEREQTTIEKYKAELWAAKKQKLDNKHAADKQTLDAEHAVKIESMKADIAKNQKEISDKLTERKRQLEEESYATVAMRQSEHEELVKEHTKEKELTKDKLQKQLDHVSELYKTEQLRIMEQKRQFDLEKRDKMRKLEEWYVGQRKEIINRAVQIETDMNLRLQDCQQKYEERKEDIENDPEDSQSKLEELEEQQTKIKQEMDALSEYSSDASSEASDVSNVDSI